MKPLYPATPNELYGLWGSQPGDLWAAGRLVHWKRRSFTSATSGMRSLALSMWGSGPQDVWLADDDASASFQRHWVVASQKQRRGSYQRNLIGARHLGSRG